MKYLKKKKSIRKIRGGGKSSEELRKVKKEIEDLKKSMKLTKPPPALPPSKSSSKKSSKLSSKSSSKKKSKTLPKGKARIGTINTPHGLIKTPAFIFCATKAALKALSTTQAKNSNTQIILSNTYHLMLQPGEDIIANHGGLHKFMNWNGPMLTDSGGFQIFSLGGGSVANEIKRVNITNNRKLNPKDEIALFPPVSGG